MKPFHVIGNVYYVGSAGLSAFLIHTSQGDILLDGALPETAPQIEKNIATLGFSIKNVKYLLNSHSHFDHAGGLAQLKRDSGAQLVISTPDAESIRTGGRLDFAHFTQYPPVQVDRQINDGEQVKLGDTALTAVITPGHSKGCTTWTMPVQENGKTLNVVFYCSTSVPGYSLVNQPEYKNIISDYRSSFAKLKKLKCDVFLGPHAEFFDMKGKLARMGPGKPNPFIDPSELSAVVAESERSFEATLRDQQAKQAKGGK